jgi:mRNA interferase MazF
LKRGQLYRVRRRSGPDPKKFRVFVIVSRQILIDSRFSTLTCAPIYSQRHGLSTQVDIGPDEGLKSESAIHCDELVSLPKTVLTHFVGQLPQRKIEDLNRALEVALDL